MLLHLYHAKCASTVFNDRLKTDKLSVLSLTLWTQQVGIPTLRKLPYAARSQYTVGTVC